MMQVIANRWYAVLSARRLRGRPVGVRRFGMEVVFWRRGDGSVVGAVDECPHRRAKLSPGKVVDGCIECPFHGFRFDGDGGCTAIPAHPGRAIPKAMALRVLTVREEHELVWVWTGPEAAPEEPVPFFDFGGYRYDGSEFETEVATHYTKAIENQLDFPHLPFVHRNTIGRLVGESMEVVTKVDGDRIVAYSGDPDGFLELCGPNVWRLKTGPTWQFLAFVPVDEERMLYISRTYQGMVKVPGLRWVMGAVTRLVNGIVLGQDTPVVETQPVEETRLRGHGEILVPSDGPIIAYRRWREAHRGPFGAAEEPGLVRIESMARTRTERRAG